MIKPKGDKCNAVSILLVYGVETAGNPMFLFLRSEEQSILSRIGFLLLWCKAGEEQKAFSYTKKDDVASRERICD